MDFYNIVMRGALLILCFLTVGCTWFQPIDRRIGSVECPTPRNGVIVLMYHRFNEKYPSTSVTEDMLQEHIRFFKREGFRFMSLSELVDNLIHRLPLPERAVAFTLDDAYRSAYEVAHPVLEKEKVPYTIFVNTEGIDRGFSSYMTWNQLRELSHSPLVSLEAHGHTHAYMIRDMKSTEREEDIKQSVLRIYRETGQLPRFFSYPFGETGKEFIREVRNYSWNIDGNDFRFKAAFATQSGPVGCYSDLFALPRFALNMRYGKLGQSLTHKMKSRPLPVKSFLPENYVFCESDKQKTFVLTVPEDYSLERLQCFSTNGDSRVEAVNNKAQIILDSPLKSSGLSRERINCTLPTGRGDFFWLGKEFSVLKC